MASAKRSRLREPTPIAISMTMRVNRSARNIDGLIKYATEGKGIPFVVTLDIHISSGNVHYPGLIG
jgi:hypothetical protein